MYTQKLPLAIGLECQSMGTVGFVAIVNYIENITQNPLNGSPVYQIKGDHVEIVQYFKAPHQHRSYLRYTLILYNYNLTISPY